MPTKSERSGERRFRLMAAASLGAHVLAFGLWSLQSVAPSVAPRASLPASEVEIEMVDPAAQDVPFEGAHDAPAGPAPLGSAVRANAAEPSAGEPSGDAALDELITAEGEAPDGVATAPPGAAAPRRLSLDQLGVGQSIYLPPNAVDRRGGAPQKKAPVDYAARLDHGMAVAIAHDDQKKGLGPEGPVITQVLASVYRGTLPANSNARLSVSADGEGRVLSVSVVSSDGAPEEWQKLAAEVFAKLGDKRLRSMGKRGFRFTLRVASRVQLPSGADPGVNVSAFGVPIAKGAGPRSASVSILNPTNPGEVLGLMGDLSDIGAVARRVVRAHLESLEILGPPAGAAKAAAP